MLVDMTLEAPQSVRMGVSSPEKLFHQQLYDLGTVSYPCSGLSLHRTG